jgi:hypothetical protein
VPQTPGAADGAWSLAATFAREDGRVYATAVASWDRGFVAIGQSQDFEAMSMGPGEPRVWTSVDGRTWVEEPLEFGTLDLALVGIGTLANGRLMAIGVVGYMAGVGNAGAAPVQTVAWTSQDARAWDESELPLADGIAATSVAFGPTGIVMAAGPELWFSGDGSAWSPVHQAPTGAGLWHVAAGEEGFVAKMYSGSDGGASLIASGDGVTWSEASVDHVVGAAAPLNGDWLATSYPDDPPTIAVLHSENGLDWTPALDVNDLTPADGPKAGQGMASGITEARVIGSAGGSAFLTLGWNHCCVALTRSLGVWSSTNGSQWSPILPEGNFVVSAASNSDVTVLAGYLGVGAEAAFWVEAP